MRCSDFSPPISLHFVAFVPQYRHNGGDDEISQGSWGTLAYMPRSGDPGGTIASGHSGEPYLFDATILPSAITTASAPAVDISGLNHAACTLAVYASQPRSPVDHARLATGWWPTLAGRDLNPQGPYVKFLSCRDLHNVLLTQAWPGALGSIHLLQFGTPIIGRISIKHLAVVIVFRRRRSMYSSDNQHVCGLLLAGRRIDGNTPRRSSEMSV